MWLWICDSVCVFDLWCLVLGIGLGSRSLYFIFLFFCLVARKVRGNKELRIWVLGIWLLGNKFFIFIVLSFVWWIIFFLIFCNYLMRLKMLRIVWIELFYYVEIAFKSIQWKTSTTMGELQVGREHALELQEYKRAQRLLLLLLVTVNIVLMNESDCKWRIFFCFFFCFFCLVSFLCINLIL